MSIMPAFRQDDSAMYKRFAYLASTYLDQPEIATTPVAQIPLENLYRLLEMYRYGSFKDETRSGILAFRSTSEVRLMRKPKPWHTQIEQAMKASMEAVFVGRTKDQAIDEIEETMRSLVNNENLDKQRQAHVKQFFNSFSQALA